MQDAPAPRVKTNDYEITDFCRSNFNFAWLCGIRGGGPAGQSLRILASDVPAIHAIAATVETNCAATASEFTRNHTTEASQTMNAALKPKQAEYSSVIVANSTLMQLMNDGLVRPLNDLVAKHGQHVPGNLKITIDGNVMAIAFMANSQHLFTLTDLLARAGVEGIPAP